MAAKVDQEGAELGEFVGFGSFIERLIRLTALLKRRQDSWITGGVEQGEEGLAERLEAVKDRVEPFR